jgi:hypothetical protein
MPTLNTIRDPGHEFVVVLDLRSWQGRQSQN